MQILTVYNGYGEKLGKIELSPEQNRARLEVRGMVAMTFFSLSRALAEIRGKYPNAYVDEEDG